VLTGRPPFQAETVVETLLQVQWDEPVPPARLRHGLPRDLQTVCLKCLHKEPRRRYASARDLADDLGRFLDGKPLRARPVGAVGRSWSWCRRNPLVASLLAIVVIVFAGGFAGVTWKWLEADEQRQQAVTLGSAKDAALVEAGVNLYSHSIALAHREWLADNVVRAEQLLDACPLDLRHPRPGAMAGLLPGPYSRRSVAAWLTIAAPAAAVVTTLATALSQAPGTSTGLRATPA
jgi:hypothetical protein